MLVGRKHSWRLYLLISCWYFTSRPYVLADEKKAWAFFPDSQYIYIAVTIVISGSRLSTVDKIAIAVSCDGRIENSSSDIAGGDPRTLVNISNEGRQGQTTFMFRSTCESCKVCIKFSTSTSWERVSSNSFVIKSPRIDAGWFGAIDSTQTYTPVVVRHGENMQLFLSGAGLVRGINRLAFKFVSTRDSCSSANELTEALELSAAYNDGMIGVLSFALFASNADLALCISSNSEIYSVVDTLQFTYIGRDAHAFMGSTVLIPSVISEFYIIGKNFDAAVPSYVKLDQSCDGVTDSSNIEGGEGIMADFVNSSCLKARFRILPSASNILSVSVVSMGMGYQDGILLPLGREGYFFAASFVTDQRGGIADIYITSGGEGYIADPILVPAYSDSVVCSLSGYSANCSCYFEPGANRTNCSMTGTVVTIVKGLGVTRGCFTDTVELVGVGGGGSGFRAAIINDDVGEIVGFDIVNHGFGYTRPPQLVVHYRDYIGACTCGSVFFNGLPTAASLVSGTIVGNLDPCFKATIASGAQLVVSDSGRKRRENIRLCARLGSTAVWSQVGNTSLSIQEPLTSQNFLPSTADSFEPFVLTVFGTGFELEGSTQTKIKLTRNCSESNEDDSSSAFGGEGVPCESLRMNQTGSTQVCTLAFTVAAPVRVQLQVCRRIGFGRYFAISPDIFTVYPFSINSFSPNLFRSSAASTITIFGSNFGNASLSSISFRACSKHLCDLGMDGANVGEPCSNVSDNRTCLAGSKCVQQSNFSAASAALLNSNDAACSLPGGEVRFASQIGGCLHGNSNCSNLVLHFSFLSMADIGGDIWWSFQSRPFERIKFSNFSLQGSSITDTSAVPQIVKSLANFSFSIRGMNLGAVGASQAKFKYTSGDICPLDGSDFDNNTVPGGSGRALQNLQVLDGKSLFGGVLSFQLAVQEHFETVLVDWRIDPKYQTVRLCWKIGSFVYRDVGKGTITTVETTRIVGFTPSDGMKDLSSSFALQNQQIPVFRSNQAILLTVVGRNIGSSPESLKIRLVPMPFDLNAAASQGCVSLTTTTKSRVKSCKEFPVSVDDPFGGAADICTSGSEIQSVLSEDDVPFSVLPSTILIPSSDPFLAASSDAVDYANFLVSRTLLRAGTRFMLCWKASVADSEGVSFSPWQPIGNFIARQSSFQSFYVFNTHSFIITGAYVSTIEPSYVVSHRAFSLNLRGVGVRCNNTEIKVKLTIGNALQASVGGPIGKGCASSNFSDTYGSADGSFATFAICTASENPEVHHLSASFPMVVVEYDTALEVCWSTAYGDPLYDHIFLTLNRTAIATILALPAKLESFEINNAAPGDIIMYPHTRLSFLMFGSGLSVFGQAGARVKVSENCDVDNATIPGGEPSPVACVFNSSVATAEFFLNSSSTAAKLCFEARQSDVVWIDYLNGYKCDPEICGAPSCATANYILDSFQCDSTCCQETCSADPYCKYYTWYEIPSRVYRRCQTSADCNSFSLPVNTITIPHVLQKTRYLSKRWIQIGPNFTISKPQVYSVTPQARPPPVSGTTFAVNLQGDGMGFDNMQVHVKLVDRSAFNGGCNNETSKALHLRQFQEIEDQKAAALKYRAYLKTLNMNGTCAGGKYNCEKGPAPPLTVCSRDSDCWGPSGAAGGGACVPANTGQNCLWNTDCSHAGFCNNSLAYLTLTPLPEIPEIKIPYPSMADDGTIDGGYGRYVQPKNSSFATVLFLTYGAKDVIFCVAMRDASKESMYVKDGYITDIALINSLYGYSPLAEFTVFAPSITTVFPDHTFTNVNTVFVFGGYGFSPKDTIKLVYGYDGCTAPGLSPEQADVHGVATGTKPSTFDEINFLRTNASVSFKVYESTIADDNDDTLLLCYKFFGSDFDGFYRPVGNVSILNKPPVVVEFSPTVLFSFETTQISLLGTGLGGAQRLKLVRPEVGCRGSQFYDAHNDWFALFPGSRVSQLKLNYTRQFETLRNPEFADHLYLTRMSAVFQVRSYQTSEVSLQLCITYSDTLALPLSTTASGYHSIGNLTLRPPKVTSLLTDAMQSGTPSGVLLFGEGLETALASYVKLVEPFSRCDEGDGYVIVGGLRTAADRWVNSSTLRAVFSVAAGLSTAAKVCHCFEMISNGIVCNWTEVGSLKVRLPALEELTMSSMYSGITESPLGSTDLQSIVTGEPFVLLAQFSHPVSLSLKLVPSSQKCRGQDRYADAFVGGEGQSITVEGQGNFSFPSGISVPPGFSLPLLAKACIYYSGGAGYEDLAPAASWRVIAPFISSIRPEIIVTTQPPIFDIQGQGIATASMPSFLAMSASAQCDSIAAEVQISSEDMGNGRIASASFPSIRSEAYGATIALCWRLGDADRLLHVGSVSVVRDPIISELVPRRWLQGNSTAFLLAGFGLSSRVVTKLVPSPLGCVGSSDIQGCQSTGGQTGCIAASRWDAVGLTWLSAPVSLAYAGSMRLCYAPGEGMPFRDSGLNITVAAWDPVYLLSSTGAAGLKTDTQRVEARMTDNIPPCTRLWRSNYTLLSQKNGIDRDSPFVYTTDSDAKCWATCDLVPDGYEKLGLCPPGIDPALTSVSRNVPASFVLAGGLEAGDYVFVSSSCGGDLTSPALSYQMAPVPGGEPVQLAGRHRYDVTELVCNQTKAAIGAKLTGQGSRTPGWVVNFSLSSVSAPGDFHRLCVLKGGFAAAFAVPGVAIKVTPPTIYSAEPSTVWAGRSVSIRLNGLGLSKGDRISVIDGQRALSCYNGDADPSLPGSFHGYLGDDTTPFHSDLLVRFDIPSTHARVCYMYSGSSVWEEMTTLLSLRTSGYVYGYESTTHFLYGESAHLQNESNLVGGTNQTISVLPPRPVGVLERSVYARSVQSELTVHGYGLTESARIAVVPTSVGCGGQAASRVNLIRGAGSLITPLHTIPGGETRYPAGFVNDGASGRAALSRCSGSRQVDGCAVGEDSAVRAEYGPLGIAGVGRARVCVMPAFASEFVEAGQVDVLRPCVTSLAPTSDVLLNRPVLLTLTGVSLSSTDLLKVVDGATCYGSVASRPYLVALAVADPPHNSSAVANLTVTGPGPGPGSSGARRVCYSYDGGASFADTGLSLRVRSPRVLSVFPTGLSLSAERRLTFRGDAVREGDRVQAVHADRACEGSTAADAVFGGGERPLEIPDADRLPPDAGAAPWPPPARSGTAVFLLPRLDPAVLCYRHRDGAGWATVRTAAGDAVTLTVVDTEELAYGATGPGRARWSRLLVLGAALPFVALPIYLSCKCFH